MGQAKRRGTFEERKAQAIERDKSLEKERIKKLQDEWEAMSDIERQVYISKRAKRANLENCLMGILGMGFCGMHDPSFWGPPKVKRS